MSKPELDSPGEEYSTIITSLTSALAGSILPKLTGFFKVGYRTREADSGRDLDDSTLGLDADFTWAATPKLTNKLSLSRDFGVGGEGDGTVNTSASIKSDYGINEFYSATAFLSYVNRDYDNVDDREDDQIRFGARLTYSANQYLRLSAGYTYTENDSNLVGRSYEDHSFDISASLRY